MGLIRIVFQQPLAQPLDCVNSHRLYFAKFHQSSYNKLINRLSSTTQGIRFQMCFQTRTN